MSLCCHPPDRLTEKKFKIAIFATSLIFIIEVAGGFWANSLALLSDAVHLFMDVFSLFLSWGALKFSRLPATDKRTFGFHRLEIFAAFLNGISLLIISVIIFRESWERFFSPEPVKGVTMLLVAVLGLMVNLLVVFYLRDTNKNDLNLHSAVLHILGDALASVGVIAGGLIILLTGYFLVDSIISFLISIIIAVGSVRIILKSSHILLEGVPEGINLDNVVSSLTQINGVTGVHGIHIWSICSNVFSLSAHITVKDQSISSGKIILNEVNDVLVNKYKITNNTIQFECDECEDNSLYKNLSH
ncbi:MAG: cation diffusion facilitator family transporter [Nitrospinota bacterium]